MEFNTFEGIAHFHDGQAVSDYCNMIPLGESAIDRVGEQVVAKLTTARHRVVGTFVDSKQTLYVARDDGLWHATKVGDEFQCYRLMQFDSFVETVTFCESSTKPSQVYMCDGRNVYYWNTEPIAIAENIPIEFRNRVLPYRPIQLPLFDSIDAIRGGAEAWLKSLPYIPFAGTETRYGFWPTVNKQNWDMARLIGVSSITWFDNRLVCVQKNKNTVWLTAVDPSRYITPTTTNNINAPMAIMQYATETTITNEFMPHYYSSTASSANLQDAIAFAGQLYFLNDSTIEVWSATGNAENPIQHNSQNTLYYGGRSPVIVADALYLLCRDAIHNEFVAVINQGGSINRISNNEIERYLSSTANCIKPLSVRDKSMIVVYNGEYFENGYAITKENRWWRYYNGTRDDEFCAWNIAVIDGVNLGITNFGNICKCIETSRTYCDGRAILRSIRGCFSQFVTRKVINEIEIICDAGVHMLPKLEPRLFVRVSTNRGLNFGQYKYRTFGKSGQNAKRLIWNRCASGNSMLIEFGTADNVRFQVYGLRVELI